jgi:hypothetical protein
MWTLLAATEPYVQEMKELAAQIKAAQEASAHTMGILVPLSFFLSLLLVVGVWRIGSVLRQCYKLQRRAYDEQLSPPTPPQRMITDENAFKKVRMETKQSVAHHPAVRGVMPDSQSPLPPIEP